MASTAPSPASVPGVLHYIPPITAFEPTSILQRSLNINTLLWVGGLFDTYHSVTYPYTLSQRLSPSWSMAQVLLSSSAHGWGTGSLGHDVEELAKAVRYFREKRPGGKVVLMGHSTGCQDGMHYVVSEGAGQRPPVDGLILQAPVSDREALVHELPADVYKSTNELAGKWIAEGREEDCLPFAATERMFGQCPISARRWLSLASPDAKGEDDYFSSDLCDERLRETFGKMPKGTKLLIIHSGSDEHVPKGIDPEVLSRKWMDFVREGGGYVDGGSSVPVKGATHNLNGVSDGIVDDLCQRIVEFVESI